MLSADSLNPPTNPYGLISTVMLVLLLQLAASGQGGGSASTGTDGSDIISGKIFFPSARRLDNSIQVRLQSYTAGEISAMSDSSGSFTFGSLAVTTEGGASRSYLADDAVNLIRCHWRFGLSRVDSHRRHVRADDIAVGDGVL